MTHGRSERWLVYALGGGLGHVHRGLAIARKAAARGHTVDLLVNSPWMHLVESASSFFSGVSLCIIPADAKRHEVIERVERQLQVPYEVIIVDTFARGLAGELANHLSDGRRWAFVHRDLTTAYANRDEVQAAAQRYAVRIAPGERGPLYESGSYVETGPIVLCEYQDLLAPSDAHQVLGTDPDGPPVIAIVFAGRPDEHSIFTTLQSELKATPLQLRTVVAWPFAPLLPAVDAVIGTGGYQTVFECRLTQTPLFAMAMERLYDRQAMRLRPGEQALPTPQALKSISRRIPIRPFSTGASKAVQAIESA